MINANRSLGLISLTHRNYIIYNKPNFKCDTKNILHIKKGGIMRISKPHVILFSFILVLALLSAMIGCSTQTSSPTVTTSKTTTTSATPTPSVAPTLPAIISMTTTAVGTARYTESAGFRQAIEKLTPMQVRLEATSTAIAWFGLLENGSDQFAYATGEISQALGDNHYQTLQKFKKFGLPVKTPESP